MGVGSVWRGHDFFKGKRYIGIDIIHRGLTNRDVQSDMCFLPFSDNSIGSIIQIGAIEHVAYPDGPARAVEEFHRVLRPKGKLLFDAICNYEVHADADYWRFTPAGVHLLLKNFKILREEVDDSPIIRRQPRWINPREIVLLCEK